MAIASVAARGTGASSTSGSTLGMSPSATLAVGTVQILTIAKDNSSTVDNSDNSEVTSVTDNATSTKNTWRKLAEYTNSPTGAAADGVTVSVWVCHIATAITTSNTITGTFAANCTDKACSLWEYTTAGGNSVVKDTGFTNPVKNETLASNGFGSAAFSGLTSAARLYFRGLGKEANVGTSGFTASTNFTAITMLRSRNNASAVGVCGEFRINTSTGETSNPTLAVSGDTAGIFLALIEGPEQISVTDTLKAGLSDTRPLIPLTQATTDSLKAGLTEPTTENIGVPGETLKAGLSEAATVDTGSVAPTSKSASDSLRVQVGDLSSLSVSSAGDSLKAGLTDTASLIGKAIATTDTLKAGLSESPTVNTGSLIEKTATDTLTVQLIEPTTENVNAPGETLAVHVSESAPSISAGGVTTKNTSDTLKVQVGELSTTQISRNGDGLTVQISETAVVQKAFAVSDSLSPRISETTALSKAITTTDSLAVQLTANASVDQGGTVTKTAADSGAVKFNESTGLVVTVSVADSLRAGLGESAAVQSSVHVADTCQVGASDVSTFAVNLAVADNVAARLSEAALVNATFTTNDTGQVQLSESASVITSADGLVSVSVVDALAIGLGEDERLTHAGAVFGGRVGSAGYRHRDVSATRTTVRTRRIW